MIGPEGKGPAAAQVPLEGKRAKRSSARTFGSRNAEPYTPRPDGEQIRPRWWVRLWTYVRGRLGLG